MCTNKTQLDRETPSTLTFVDRVQEETEGGVEDLERSHQLHSKVSVDSSKRKETRQTNAHTHLEPQQDNGQAGSISVVVEEEGRIDSEQRLAEDKQRNRCDVDDLKDRQTVTLGQLSRRQVERQESQCFFEQEVPGHP